MYEHAIPQNIMDYEFKLFAGLSLKQFIILGVTGGLCFGLVQLKQNGLLPDLFLWMLIPVVLLTGVGFGLGSYQKRPFDAWISDYIRAVNSPLRRVWKKTQDAVKADQFMNTKVTSYPQYLSVYFLNEDEYKKIMQFSSAQQMAATPVNITPTVYITPQNIADFADPNIVLPMIPNTIAFRVLQDGIPVEGVTVYVKDANNNVIMALNSNQDGILYFDQSFPNGIFVFEFQSETMDIPKHQVTFEGGTYPLINIIAPS